MVHPCRRRLCPAPALTSLVLAPLIGCLALIGVAGPASAVSLTATGVNLPGVNAAQSEAYFTSQINAARSAAGVPALATAWDIVAVARMWSGVMASGTGLAHNPSVQTQITNWSWIGENVGVGYSDDSLWSAFMNSPHHRDNILDPNYTQMGVGVVIGADGYIYVTQDFRRPNGAPAAVPAPLPVPSAVGPAAVPPSVAPAIIQVPAAPTPPDPTTLARAALVRRIAAARREADSDGTVLLAFGFATVMTGR